MLRFFSFVGHCLTSCRLKNISEKNPEVTYDFKWKCQNERMYSWTICKVEKFFCWPLTIGNWGNFSFHAVSCLNPMSVLDSVSANFPDIIFWAFHRWPAALPWTKRRFPEAFNTRPSWDLQKYICALTQDNGFYCERFSVKQRQRINPMPGRNKQGLPGCKTAEHWDCCSIFFPWQGQQGM